MTAEEKKMLADAGYDVDGALARFVNNDTIYRMFLKKMDGDPNFMAIEPALSAGNYDDAYKATHALKGIVGNLGINDEFECTKELLALIKEKTPSDVPVSDAMAVYEKIKACHEKACSVISGIA